MTKKQCPYCWEYFDELYFRGRWCSRDCYLGDLDRYMEEKWEEQKLNSMSEDDWKEDR